MKLRSVRRPVIVGTAAVAVIALGLGGTAAADAFITGKDVKNNSLSGADIKNGSINGTDIKTNTVTWKDIANGTVRSTEIRNGSIELRDMSDEALEELLAGILGVLDELGIVDGLETIAGDVEDVQTDLVALAARVKAAEGTLAEVVADAAAIDDSLTALDSRIDALEAADAVSAGNWGTQLRNVMGSATAALREGPTSSAFGPLSTPPAGTGSLQIDVANTASKVSFGNEVDFAGDAPSSLGSPSYQVYTTGENITIGGAGVVNVPTLNVELNPNVAGRSYTSLVFTPTKVAVPGWNTFNTATDGYWWFSQAQVATATGCGQANSCTLTQALAGLGDDAALFTVGINKGRDYEFHGAVDALQVGGTTYDFEARGVIASS